MKKKIAKIVLAALLMCSLLLSFASCSSSAKLDAAENNNGSIEGTDITWVYNADDQKLTINGTGAIPDCASSEDVWWYSERHSVKTLSVSGGITSIGNYAFYYMPELNAANIPETVTSFGNYAFAFCSSLEGIEIPDALTRVGEGCFEACTSLKSIYIPATVTSIAARAFAHCSTLEDAVIMAQISSVEPLTFMGCSSLAMLHFNESVKQATVAEDAFKDAATDFSKAVFTASLTGEVTLTVNYVYADGTAAAESHVAQFKRGASYSVVSPTIDGYTASLLTVTGVISSDETVTVTYNANAADTEAPAEETEAQTQEAEEDDEGGVNVGTVVAIVIFAVVIIAIAVLVVIMIRSDKKQANGAQGKSGKRNTAKKNKNVNKK